MDELGPKSTSLLGSAKTPVAQAKVKQCNYVISPQPPECTSSQPRSFVGTFQSSASRALCDQALSSFEKNKAKRGSPLIGILKA